MLENYEISYYTDFTIILCKRCNINYHLKGAISDNIIDIHDSHQMIEQFLLLNNFTEKLEDKCVFNNAKLNITVDIYINNYDVNDGGCKIIKSPSELLDYLKERLDIESINKLIQIE